MNDPLMAVPPPAPSKRWTVHDLGRAVEDLHERMHDCETRLTVLETHYADMQTHIDTRIDGVLDVLKQHGEILKVDQDERHRRQLEADRRAEQEEQNKKIWTERLNIILGFVTATFGVALALLVSKASNNWQTVIYVTAALVSGMCLFLVVYMLLRTRRKVRP